jgi:hypothetical protein
VAIVQVQNNDGQLSAGVPVSGGENIYWKNNENYQLHMRIGQRCLIYLTNFWNEQFQWSVELLNPAIAHTLDDVPLQTVQEGAYEKLSEVTKTGILFFTAGGDLPCNAPCPGRGPMFVSVSITVE